MLRTSFGSTGARTTLGVFHHLPYDFQIPPILDMQVDSMQCNLHVIQIYLTHIQIIRLTVSGYCTSMSFSFPSHLFLVPEAPIPAKLDPTVTPLLLHHLNACKPDMLSVWKSQLRRTLARSTLSITNGREGIRLTLNVAVT